MCPEFLKSFRVMINQELAKIFSEMASFLEAEEVAFKPYAYQRTARVLKSLEEDIRGIYRKGGVKALEKVPSIGRGIAFKVEEYLKTGRIKEYEKLKKRFPIDLSKIIAVEGMGVRKAKILYQKLKVKNLKDLEKAARAGRIRGLEGFGLKTEQNILEGINFLKKSKGRFLLGEIMLTVKEIIKKLEELKEVEKVNVAGSVRRMKETVGDIDILAISKKPKEVMAFFVSLPGVVKVWGKGLTKSSIRMEGGLDVDLRVIQKKSYGSAMQYFTGSKEHNIATRKIAMSKGLKLSEYGVFKNSEMIAGKTEEEVYKAIGLSWTPPEMRENTGEVELARKGKLPKIIDYGDIRGDLHCHSDWDGGANSIEEMAETAREMGYEYLGISDHTKFLKIERGLNEKQLSQQKKEIDKINGRLKKAGLKFRVLQGAEVNILKDGSLDIEDGALKKLDYVIAGVHSNFKMEKEKMTRRIIKAMKNPNVDIISHPTGRVLQMRDEYQIDFDKILGAAKKLGVILEINSSPDRLDLKDTNIRKAKEMGVKMIINTDAHHKNQLKVIEFGVAQARRGWAEKKDIVNTQPLAKISKVFRN